MYCVTVDSIVSEPDCVCVLHSADSSIKLSGRHTTQTQTSEVRWGELHASVVTEWSPACLHKLLPVAHQRATKENLKWKMFTNYSILVLQIPFKFETNMKFFENFVCVLQMILLTKIKNLDVGTGAQQQRQEVY